MTPKHASSRKSSRKLVSAPSNGSPIELAPLWVLALANVRPAKTGDT